MKFVNKVGKVLLEFLMGCAIFLVVSIAFVFFGTWLAIFLDNYASKIENWVFLFLGIGAITACWHMGREFLENTKRKK